MAEKHGQHEPIAIVGMGCRWPGGSHDATSFWDFLCNQVDGWKQFGHPRFSEKGFHHPNPERPGGFSMKGAFLAEQDARLFDHSFFGMTALEVETMDPSQRKLLEVSYEAIENAGETWESVSGTRTGVFVGNFCLDHWMIQSRDWDNPRPYAFVGAGTSILANRISYIFNLQGPSLTVDTACSSSMYALHLAVNAIRAGDCDSAIVASANWIGDPGVQIALDKLGALSASSRCHTFDARAEGYARGEGYSAIFLKRTSLAIADESPIRAMIRGTAINSNGRTGGITRPSAAGQENVIREAYRNAGNLPFQDTSYFECHGTGTYVGDPIETAAVGRVFAEFRTDDDPLLVGSVKSNVGHGEGASALASVMKVVLALENGAIPPLFNLETRNPNIDFDNARVRPVTEVTPWPDNRLRRASINSFGYGGANAHCIIDHVENVLPNYIAPGVYKKEPSNGYRIGLLLGSATNGHQNGLVVDGINGKPKTNGLPINGINGNPKPNGLQTNGFNESAQEDGTMINGANTLTNGSQTSVNGTSEVTYENGDEQLHNGHANGDQPIQFLKHAPVIQRLPLTSKANALTRDLVLLPFSGHNETSLRLGIQALSKVITRFPLADIAYTLSSRRSRFVQRSFCIVEKNNRTQTLSLDKKSVRAPLRMTNVGFIFTGQGAQWHGMGAELFEYRVFRDVIRYLDQVLSALSDPPNWSLERIVSGDCDASLIQTAEIAQASCTAIQVALVDLLASWSIRPLGVAGHSSGEIAAAYAAGRITAADAIVAAYLRGQAVSKNTQEGAMLAVGLGVEEIASFIQGREKQVKVAAINSPGSVTLSGEVDTIDEISSAMTASSVFNRKLKTGGNAYHSHHMLPIGRDYVDKLSKGKECINQLKLDDPEQRYPMSLWVSSVTPSTNLSKIEDFSFYWKANLESPVLFSEAVARLVNTEDVPIHTLVEIGPHPALKGPVEQILKSLGKTVGYASTLKRQEDGRRSLLQLAGNLFNLNTAIDILAVNATEELNGKSLEHGRTCTALPPYQYTYGSLNYHESRASKEYRYRSTIRHDLLGSKVVGNAKLRPQWRNILRMKDVLWLGHHRLIPDAVLPAAGYVAMAVEAVQRIHGEFSTEPLEIDGFTLADVAIEKSLVLPEDDYGVEVLTSLELPTAQSTAWATFLISSVSRESDEWTEHCTGRVKVTAKSAVGEGEKREILPVPGTSRAVDTEAWYRKFAEIGLGYGPAFQPLSNIRSDVSESNLAVATVNLNTTESYVKGGESRYVLHPAALDGAIQLGLIACHGGRHNEARTAFIPVRLSHLHLSNALADNVHESCTVVARGERRGIRGAHLDLQMLGLSGDVLVQVNGLRCISFSSAAKANSRLFSSPFTRLVWKPDIRSLSIDQARRMFPPPEANVKQAPAWAVTNKIAHFVVYSVYEIFGNLQSKPEPSGDVGHFFDWIQRKGRTDRSMLMDEARELAAQGLLVQAIEELVDQAPNVMEVKIAKLLHDNMADILYERRTGIDVILGEDLLTPLYKSGLLMTGIYPQLRHVLSGLAHSNPNARILEIGGGTGGATRIAMQAFNGPNNIKAYRDYTFTDISAGFLSEARGSMAHLLDINFSVFDIELDPVDQGYTEESYDLIIACQVLHATSNMNRTLTNCRRLLNPGGRLVLVETNENFIVPGVVVGTFTGYWAGIPDGRVDAPFLSLSDWDRSLRDAGFSGIDVVLDDFPEPHNTTSVIVSTVSIKASVSLPSPPVHILFGGDKAPSLASHISKALEQRGSLVQVSTFDAVLESLPTESRVIAFFNNQHLLLDANEDLQMFQQLSRKSASLVALTSCGIVKGRNADGALISGLFRVLGNENPATEYVSIDIDADHFDMEEDNAKSLARCIVDHELSLHQDLLGEDSGSPKDREYSWQDGSMWVSRHVPDAGFHSQHGFESRSMKPELLQLRSQGPIRATFESPGVLSSLCFEPCKALSQPLRPDFIDVEVSAIGLNSHDLDHWTGRVDADYLSSEYAGVIREVGAAVTELKVGDRVYGLGKGHFGNYTRVPAAMAGRLQSSDDLIHMASMPMAYATAVYVLDIVARLRKGQSVLVQDGGNDVGLGLICLAISKGAEVFAMVKTAEEEAFLSGDLAMPSSHVLQAASSFAALQSAAQMTRNHKFDVIISRGSLLHSFFQIIAPFGHLVGLGRTGGQSPPALGIGLLPQNASYASVDSFAIVDLDAELGAELMQTVDNYYRQGLIRPIPKITTLNVAQLGSSIGNHSNAMGKLVVSFEDPESIVKMVPSAPSIQFDAESSYLITGGLGSLGQSLVRWMGERGARNMALLSRRSASNVPGIQNLIKSLSSRGIYVECYVCDVSDKDQVTHTVQEISARRPIKGVIHAAVSYLDLTFDKLSSSRWNEGLSAKVTGTKNLHEALLSTPLDFFVMTTSALSVYAFPTQGAYTAANNFQDAFARYRRRLGLPASTASFSLIRDVSEVGSNELTIKLFERNKTLMLDESQFLMLFESALLNNRTTKDPSTEQWFGQVEDPLSAANLHTYLDPAAMLARKQEELAREASTSKSMPRWYSDGRISLMMRAYSDAQQHSINAEESPAASSKPTPASIRKRFEEAVKGGGASGRASTLAFVQEAITHAVAEMLFVDVEGIDVEKSVADLGVDSLIAAELRNWFLQALGTTISMLDLLDPSLSIVTRAAAITDKAWEATTEA